MTPTNKIFGIISFMPTPMASVPGFVIRSNETTWSFCDRVNYVNLSTTYLDQPDGGKSEECYYDFHIANSHSAKEVLTPAILELPQEEFDKLANSLGRGLEIGNRPVVEFLNQINMNALQKNPLTLCWNIKPNC